MISYNLTEILLSMVVLLAVLLACSITVLAFIAAQLVKATRIANPLMRLCAECQQQGLEGYEAMFASANGQQASLTPKEPSQEALSNFLREALDHGHQRLEEAKQTLNQSPLNR